jgi:hypothetical protein
LGTIKWLPRLLTGGKGGRGETRGGVAFLFEGRFQKKNKKTKKTNKTKKKERRNELSRGFAYCYAWIPIPTHSVMMGVGPTTPPPFFLRQK